MQGEEEMDRQRDEQRPMPQPRQGKRQTDKLKYLETTLKTTCVGDADREYLAVSRMLAVILSPD
jgi:hypothetical protein